MGVSIPVPQHRSIYEHNEQQANNYLLKNRRAVTIPTRSRTSSGNLGSFGEIWGPEDANKSPEIFSEKHKSTHWKDNLLEKWPKPAEVKDEGMDE